MITIECRKCGATVKGSIAETLAWDARHECALVRPATGPACVMCLHPEDSATCRSDGRCCSGCRDGCPCALPPGELKRLRDASKAPP